MGKGKGKGNEGEEKREKVRNERRWAEILTYSHLLRLTRR